METRIVIIDSNPYTSKLITYALEDAGYSKLVHYFSVEDFRNTGFQPEPDCLIIDHTLPGLSGTEFTREIRSGEMAISRDTAIILCLPDGDEELVEDATNAQPTDICTKDISPLDLVKKLQKAIEKPKDPVDSMHYAGPDRRRKNKKFPPPDRRVQNRPMSQADINTVLKASID